MTVINGHKIQAPASQEIAERKAEQHVEWFLTIIKPLLTEFMVHGFKHGQKFEQECQKIREQ